jgi:hypothetical protein
VLIAPSENPFRPLFGSEDPGELRQHSSVAVYVIEKLRRYAAKRRFLEHKEA